MSSSVARITGLGCNGLALQGPGLNGLALQGPGLTGSTVEIAPLPRGGASTQLTQNSLNTGILSEREQKETRKQTALITKKVIDDVVDISTRIFRHLDQFETNVKLAHDELHSYLKRVREGQTFNREDLMGMISITDTLQTSYFKTVKQSITLCGDASGILSNACKEKIALIFEIRRNQLEEFAQALKIAKEQDLHAVHIMAQRLDLKLKDQEQMFTQGLQVLDWQLKACQLQGQQALEEKKEDYSFTLENQKLSLNHEKQKWEIQAQGYAKELEQEVELEKIAIDAYRAGTDRTIGMKQKENEEITAVGGVVGNLLQAAPSTISAAESFCTIS